MEKKTTDSCVYLFDFVLIILRLRRGRGEVTFLVFFVASRTFEGTARVRAFRRDLFLDFRVCVIGSTRGLCTLLFTFTADFVFT